jgi:hypothetical protein
VWFFLLATFADFSSGLARLRRGLPAVRWAGLSTGFIVGFFGKWTLEGSVLIQFALLR